MPPCPYKVLSVPKTATLSDIKLAYRKLALQLHPDTNGGDAIKSEKFKSVSAAYEILSNATERKKYENEQMWRQQWPTGVHRHPQWSGGFHHHQSHTAFDEEEWMAYHFGIDEVDFDIFEDDSFIFTKKGFGKAPGNRTSKKKSVNPKRGRSHFTTMSADDIDNIMNMSRGNTDKTRRAASPKNFNAKRDKNYQSHSPPPSTGPKKPHRRGRSRKKQSDCIVS